MAILTHGACCDCREDRQAAHPCRAATAAGFYAFLPTDYRGVSELGLISGTGMIVAFVTSITLLPALLTAAQASARAGSRSATADSRRSTASWRVTGCRSSFSPRSLLLRACRSVRDLKFDFNPLNLAQRQSGIGRDIARPDAGPRDFTECDQRPHAVRRGGGVSRASASTGCRRSRAR